VSISLPSKNKIKEYWFDYLYELGFEYDFINSDEAWADVDRYLKSYFDEKIHKEIRPVIKKVFMDGDFCFACNIPSNTDRAHIFPRVKNGKDTVDNLHNLCTVCHRVSENRYGEDYFRWLENRSDCMNYDDLMLRIIYGVLKNGSGGSYHKIKVTSKCYALFLKNKKFIEELYRKLYIDCTIYTVYGAPEYGGKDWHDLTDEEHTLFHKIRNTYFAEKLADKDYIKAFASASYRLWIRQDSDVNEIKAEEIIKKYCEDNKKRIGEEEFTVLKVHMELNKIFEEL